MATDGAGPHRLRALSPASARTSRRTPSQGGATAAGPEGPAGHAAVAIGSRAGSRARPGAEGGLEDVTISSILQDVTNVNDRLVDLFIAPGEQQEVSRQGPGPSGVLTQDLLRTPSGLLREVTGVNDRLIDLFLSEGCSRPAGFDAARAAADQRAHLTSYDVAMAAAGTPTRSPTRAPTRSRSKASKDVDAAMSKDVDAAMKAYLVDNSSLNAESQALAYRRSMDNEDTCEHGAEWNTIVDGVEESGGWVRVGDRFLPMQVGGVTVLKLLEPQEAMRLRDKRKAQENRPHPALVDAELQRLRRVSVDRGLGSPDGERPAPVTGAQCVERHGEDPFQDDLVLPLGAVLRGLQATERYTAARRTPLHLLYVILFTSTISLALDVPSAFEVQRGVLQSLASRPAPDGPVVANGAPPAPRVVFENVSSLAEFWGWASEALYPQVFEAERFNNLGNGSEAVFAVAKYNHVVAPVRFRQLRAKRDQCSFPADSHSLSWPCWVDYSPARADYGPDSRLAPGAASSIPGGTQYFTGGLSVMLADREAGPLGSLDVEVGHVVDLELDSSLALGRLQGMVEDRWADEWTRTLAVEVNTYNNFYGMASVFRFQVEQTLGGRLSPHVEACSCALNPYTGLLGEVHLILEVCWAVAYVAYLAYAVIDLKNGERLDYSSAYYHAAEWITLALHGVVMSGRIIWFLEDKDAFRQQHKTEFKDMYTLCEKFQWTRGSAGFGTLWLFMLTVLRVRNYKRLRLIFMTLTNSVGVLVQVCLAMLVSATPFAFAGYWLFGGRVYAFSSWPRAFGFLFRSAVEGLFPHNDRQSLGTPNALEEMRQNGPVIADVLNVSWLLLCKLLFYGMFVACGVSSFRTSRTMWARRREQMTEHGTYNLRDFLFAGILKKFSFPSLREPAELYENDIKVWKSCLQRVSRSDLESIVGQALRQDRRILEVRDFMPLFRKRADSEFDTYRRASLWVRSLSCGLKDSAGRERAPSTAVELRALLRRVSSLEEETMGLALQLHGSVAEVPLAAPI